MQDKSNHLLDLFSEDQKIHIQEHIIAYLEEEYELEIGVIAAEEIFRTMLILFGGHLYNKGVEESLEVIKEKLEHIEGDIETLLIEES